MKASFPNSRYILDQSPIFSFLYFQALECRLFLLREHRQTVGDSYRNLAGSNSGVVRAEGYYYFKLKDLMNQLKRSTYTTEIRKLTLHLRETLGAEDSKVSVNGKQIRCWKVPQENVEHKEFNNTTKFKYTPATLKEPEPY